MYAYNRSVNLRRLTERAQTEARFAAIVNTAMDAIIIVERRRIAIAVHQQRRRTNVRISGAGGDRPLGARAGSRRRRLASFGARWSRRFARRANSGEMLSAERYAAGSRRDGSTFPIDLSVSRTHMDGRAFLTDRHSRRQRVEARRRDVGMAAARARGDRHRRRAAATCSRSIARFHETQCPGVECAIHLIDDDGRDAARRLRSVDAAGIRRGDGRDRRRSRRGDVRHRGLSARAGHHRGHRERRALERPSRARR